MGRRGLLSPRPRAPALEYGEEGQGPLLDTSSCSPFGPDSSGTVDREEKQR